MFYSFNFEALLSNKTEKAFRLILRLSNVWQPEVAKIAYPSYYTYRTFKLVAMYLNIRYV